MLTFTFKKFSRSVVLRITSMMISVILMAFISIFSAMYMSQISEHDGKTINLSGSLRMMSYRIVTQVATLSEDPSTENYQKVRQLINTFEVLFNDPLLRKDFSRFHEATLQHEYDDIQQQWLNDIKPPLIQAGPDFRLKPFLPALESFVNEINNLVYGYQEVLEHRLIALKVIQTITLAITLLLISLCLYSIHQHIAKPLKALIRVAEASSRGDLSQRCKIAREDELGLLANTLDMAHTRIQASHRDLEHRIQEKTRELSRNNAIVTFLYNVAQQVNESHQHHFAFRPILEKVATISHLHQLELTLFADNHTLPYQTITLTDSGTSSPHAFTTDIFPIERNGVYFGQIQVHHPSSVVLQQWQNELFHSLVDQFATVLSLTNQLNQQRRIALLDERAIIARELHDSLAQSLSYLKIQVTRIEKGLTLTSAGPQVREPVAELREGLSSAYRQLRELLTTFRLQIGNGGLQVALSDTVNALSQQNQYQIELYYDCAHVPFAPNEEIHILQITKEALQNAIKHAHGSRITITLVENDDKTIQLRIADNGVGIESLTHKPNHYGTEIMQERCHSLNGNLVIRSLDTGGTEVVLDFSPAYLTKSASDQADVIASSDNQR